MGNILQADLQKILSTNDNLLEEYAHPQILSDFLCPCPRSTLMPHITAVFNGQPTANLRISDLPRHGWDSGNVGVYYAGVRAHWIPNYQSVVAIAASLSCKAIQLELSSETSGQNGKVYQGSVDPEWTVMNLIPHGGYILGLLVEAAIQYQSATTHKDPIHVTAHYLRPSTAGNFEIHIRTIKSGKGFTNLTVELFQKNTPKVTTHMIFGHNGPAPGDKVPLTMESSSPYARRIPLHRHPSEAPKIGRGERWTFKDHLEWGDEPDIYARNALDHPNRTNSATIGGGGTEWGSWFAFSNKEQRITSPALAFLVDMFPNLPTLLPRSVREDLGECWYPTVTLSIEFKAPIPPPSEHHASRTVGLYSTGKFMNHPQNRHEAYVEVWTAPTNVSEGKPVDGWRDNQVCLAISTQMALVIPIDEASKRANREVARL